MGEMLTVGSIMDLVLGQKSSHYMAKRAEIGVVRNMLPGTLLIWGITKISKMAITCTHQVPLKHFQHALSPWSNDSRLRIIPSVQMSTCQA